MSLHALAIALTANRRPASKLVLIHLADGADERHVSVPHLPLLAAQVGISDEVLRCILNELVFDKLIEPVGDHPFDFLAGTEGFLLRLDRWPAVDHSESPWSLDLRSVA